MRKSTIVWMEKNKERLKKYRNQYYQENKEILKEKSRIYRMNNPEKVKKMIRSWNIRNPEKKKNGQKEWKRKSLKWKVYLSRKNKERISTPKGALNQRMRHGVNLSLRYGQKNGRHWEDLVGYTFNDLKLHLEKQFTDGMNWEKFLKGNIHIDHKIPVSAFNYEKAEDIDFKKCWALSNLQPLWAKDNQKKGNRLTKPFQPSLALSI